MPRKRRGPKVILAFVGGIIALIVIGTIASAFGGGTGGASGGSGGGPQTVEYIVNGDPADVTYGPTGSDQQGTVPMDIIRPLGNPQYYAIDAQLQGDGSVTCEIAVDGKVISQAHASGSYNIASCEISKDPFTGDWQDTNSG